MALNKFPEIIEFGDGSKIWENKFDSFEVKVYIPQCDLPADIVNYGFMTPYLMIFEEIKSTIDDAKKFADINGFSTIAAEYGGSVVFFYPTNEGGWDKAPKDLFATIISETKISEYYQDGVARMRNRFTMEWQGLYIRGALHRSFLYGFGASADYIANNCLKRIDGDGLYGKGDITPVVCILQGLNVIPSPQRSDIPIVSIGNSEAVNDAFMASVDAVLIKEKAEYVDDFKTFIKKYRRMVGCINIEEDFDEMGMAVDVDYFVVPTSPDNWGDDKETKEHNIGYVAYYNKHIMEKGEKIPLVMCFHGGGDSAMCMVALSDWHLVASKHNFLLVSVDNHMNSTATEAIYLIEQLKKKYPIDNERIYSTGFSMGGVKTWDMFQEYPKTFAAVAPMDATMEVGFNAKCNPVENINYDVVLPVFYVGGEDTPLPELPFQAQKVTERMGYVLQVNKSKKQYNVEYEDRDNWNNPIWGIDGDIICKDEDEVTGSILTMHLFESENGCCYSVFGSATNQAHEMRHLNCENAWKYMSQFKRLENGQIVGGKMQDIVDVLES